MPWPSTIPHDLKLALEATNTAGEWRHTFRAWARCHGLHLKLQWMRGLALDLAERDRQRTPPTDQDRWGIIKEWLERYGVEAPVGLPVAPEMRGGKFV